MAILAAAYLVVGFAGEIACAEDLSTSVPVGISTAEKTDEGSKKTPTVVDHCYSCVPLTVPAAVAVYEPLSMSAQISFPNETVLVLEARLPDPPPPKFLT
ncbi:hypothetical protein E0H22_02555 [Rhodopseudomonas boonkerdii]|uniref:hypothetical protein n=1 Tax=Rhodopseudomonas boonkerdii TaxID=475937 RepID=UPI001E4B4FBC|nr:hypothetical protein [Rhodopseudomonas boonkerdii]UGV24661.1 hypothetical protein E0H22_02555 [Rhodopseudomonas boonkerdii]